MSEEALMTFVVAFREGRIYTDAHDRGNGINAFAGLVLQPVPSDAFGALVGRIWQYRDQRVADQRAESSGLPTFLTHHFMHRDDWRTVCETIRELDEGATNG